MNTSFLYRNSLSIVFLLFFIGSLCGQAYTGWLEHNDFLKDYQVAPVRFGTYLVSGHFLQATFENWESEFFQMALFVILTVYLKQIGSSESNPFGEENDSELKAKKNSPWAVRKGGIWLWIYCYSLSLALLFLFLLSFFLHWYGSWIDFNEKQLLEGKQPEEMLAYIGNKKFWFESFQNWQSEFISIFSIVFLSIFLRQKGSSQSKKVNDPHWKTGD